MGARLRGALEGAEKLSAWPGLGCRLPEDEELGVEEELLEPEVEPEEELLLELDALLLRPEELLEVEELEEELPAADPGA